jgi:hypothetical protein
MRPYLVLSLILALNTPVYYLIFRLFWDGWQDFLASLELEPGRPINGWDAISHSWEILIFVSLCVAATMLTYSAYVVYLGGQPVPPLEAFFSHLTHFLEKS